MRILKTVLSLIDTLPIAFDLLEPRFAALHQIVALDLLPEMLIITRVYDKERSLVSKRLDASMKYFMAGLITEPV